MKSPRTAKKNSPCSLQLEEARVQQRRPNAAKKKLKREKVVILLKKKDGMKYCVS